MPGLFRRLIGMGSRGDAAPPPFTLELPDGWAGGYGSLGFLEALVSYARVYPECHDRVFELIETEKGIEGLYLAAAACSSDAHLILTADDIPRDLSIEHALAARVAGLLEADGLLGDPTVSSVDDPYEGRVLRWSWSLEGASPISATDYIFASDERLWNLMFSSDAASAEVNEAMFLTIASTFRVTQPTPDP